MKLKPEHVEKIRQSIAPLDTPELRREYDSDKRYRWDLLWKSGLTRWVCDVLYKYCHDDHIDTVLRKLVPPLK